MDTASLNDLYHWVMIASGVVVMCLSIATFVLKYKQYKRSLRGSRRRK